MLDISNVRIGDKLIPHPSWNETSGKLTELPPEVTVFDINDKVRSQTGYLFKVKYTKGDYVWLDAAWFIDKVEEKDEQ